MKKIVSAFLILMIFVLSLPIATMAKTKSEIRKEMIEILYGGESGSLSCDFDSYVTTSGRHEGIDFVSGYGNNVYSLTDGIVLRVSNGYEGIDGLSTISIYNEDHDKSIIYLHSCPKSTLKAGDKIKQGDRIATESWRGCSKKGGAHTHVEVRNGEQKYAADSTGDDTLDNDNPYPFWEKYLSKIIITSAKGISHSEITVTWNEIDDATKYKVLRRKAGTGNEYVTAKSSTTDTSFTDTGLEKNQRYYYKVVAYNGSTELGTSEAVGAYTKFDPPTIKAESTSKLSLSWDSVAKAESYTVRRRVDDGEYDDVKTVTETTCTDSGLTAGTRYYYWIQANCNVNEENIVAKSTSSSCYTLPNAPTITSINDTSKTEMTIKWSVVSSATSYIIERRKGGAEVYSQIGTTTDTTFKDSGLEVGQRYFYKVYAVNSGGTSSASNAMGGYTKFNEPNVTVVSTTQLDLSWDTISYAESYTVKRRRYDGEYADVATIVGTSYSDVGLEKGTQYYYWIQANCVVTGTEYVAKSTSKGRFTKLPAPSSSVNEQSVGLSWTAAKGDAAYTYKILRKEASADNYTSVATTSNLNYTDSGLKDNTTYYYYIDVLKDGNWCTNSDGITVTTPKLKDSVAPTISDVKVTDVSGDKFTFNCKLTDNIGITRVWVAIGDTSGNWYQYGLYATDGEFSHTVYTKDLAGEGDYTMCLYAYDAAENETRVEVNDISAVNLYHLDINGFVDGQEMTDLMGYVTFDLYVDGVLIGDDISDNFQLYSFGSNYEIKDIKTMSGYIYEGISENSKELTGTIEGLNVVELILEKEKMEDYNVSFLKGVVIDGSFYAEAEITKNTDRDAVDTIIIAVYKDDILIDRIYMRSNFAQGQKVVFGGFLQGIDGATLKAFVWDSITSMNTLSNIIEK